MTDKVVLYINGKRHEIAGAQVFEPLTDYLRYTACHTGTKVVCAEGDCGACSVLLGKPGESDQLTYQAVNGCIQYVYQLHGTHIVTVEGVCKPNGFNPVQKSMMACQGAQCGYCTPGFVVTMSGMMAEKKLSGSVSPASLQEVKNALTGNLCRCTGYEAILNAGASTDLNAMPALSELYDDKVIQSNLSEVSSKSVCVQAEDRTVYIPANLKDALSIYQSNLDARLVTGGTDLHVICNKRHLAPETIIVLGQLNELNTISVTDGILSIGANVSLGNLEKYLIENNLLPEVSEMLHLFGAPQIKNAGTLAGNIANGSPIADNLPFLFVLNAEIELSNADKSRRININDFYTDYKKNVMTAGEIITGVHIPLPKANQTLKIYKVSRRMHLDISAFTAAFLMTLDKNSIEAINIAYGGVGPVVMRMKKTEAFLKGKPFELNTFETAGNIAVEEVTPIGDVRGSKEYRLQLSKNILMKLLYESSEAQSGVPS